MIKQKAFFFSGLMFLLAGIILLSVGLSEHKRALIVLGCANIVLAATYGALAYREAKFNKKTNR